MANQVTATILPTPTAPDRPRKVWLGDFLGSNLGTGRCEWCREQFLSRNRYVWAKGFSRTFCSEACARQEDIEG